MTTVMFRNFMSHLLDAGARGVRLAGLAAAIESILHQLRPWGAYEIELCSAAPEAGFGGPYLLLSRRDRATMVVKFANPRLGPRTDVVVEGEEQTLLYDFSVYDSGANLRQQGTCAWSRLLLPLSFVVAVEDEAAVAAGAADRR